MPTAALAVLEPAVQARVRGTNGPAARAIVEQDVAALRRWVQTSAPANSSWHYVYGALSGLLMSADFNDLAARSRGGGTNRMAGRERRKSGAGACLNWRPRIPGTAPAWRGGRSRKAGTGLA